MDNLAINNQPQALAQYSRHQIDRTYADQHESILGHLICERGRSVKAALEDLRPIVSQTRRQTLSAVDWCQKLGFGGIGVGILVGAGMGAGFAILPILAGTISIKFWADSRSELPRRDAEYHLLKTTPNLPEALYALHLRGITAVKIVGAYDQLVAAIEARLEGNGEFTEAEVGEFLQVKVSGDIGLDTTVPASVSAENQTQTEIENPTSMPTSNREPIPVPGGYANAHSADAGNMVAAAPSMQNINGVESIAPRDLATDLGNNPQSTIIFGTPGAGKGMTISNAIRTLRAKLPAVTVMMVDPKGDKKERGYWESQVDIFESRALLKSSPRSSAKWMMRCVEKFQNIDGPKLLVWDELFASITVLKGQNIAKGEHTFPCLTAFQQFISLNLSLGPSSGTWVWGMSQSANLSDLGLTSGGLSTTRIIALISPDNVGSVEGYLATKAITAPKGGMETLDRMMADSPVGRACYDGKTKRWYPTARLENHSGFDRDSADWNNLGKVSPSSAPEKPYKTDPVESLERSWDIPSIEVETQAIDDKPDGLDAFPLVLTIWEYLDGKDPRTIKQISDSMKAKGKIPEDVLRGKLGEFETYKDAIKTVVSFGVSKGYLKHISDDAYEVIRNQ